MKITCDIVRDLMPLYVDDVCSDDSRKLIEDHINHCSKCQNELAAMKDPIECPPLSEVGDSKTPFSKIRKKVRIKMIAAIISTAFLVMTAMFAIQEVGVLHDFFSPYGQVFWLRAYEEMSFKEIGEIFDKSENWARINYFRAKTKIRKVIEDENNM